MFVDAQRLLGEIRRQKSVNGWKNKTPVTIVIEDDETQLASLRSSELDIRAAVSAVALEFHRGEQSRVAVSAADVPEPAREPLA